MFCGSPFRVHRILRSGPPNMLCSAGAIAIVADVLVPNITVLVSGHQQLLHWFDREHDASWIMLCNIRIITLQPWNKIYSRKVGRLSHNDKLRYFQCGQSSCHDNSWWRHQTETFPRYWPFVRGIHRSPVDSHHKFQWRGALMFWSAPEQTVQQTTERPVIWDAIAPIMTSL